MQSDVVKKYLANPRYIAPVALLLLLLNIVLLSETFWRVAELWRTPVVPVVAATKSPDNVDRSPVYNVQSLLAVPLFGIKPVTAQAEVQPREELRKSALKVRVIGLVAGENESGVAILQYSGKTRAYSIGEELEVPGTVKLLAVYPEYIIIENNRKQEKIELDKKAPVRGVTASTATPTQGGAVGDTIDLNDSKFTSLIGDARDTVQNSPLKLARFFAVSPVEESGQVIGYEIKPGRDSRLFEALELQAGDRVLSVNGQTLADLAPAELMKMMENTSSFELLVDRNGSILSKRLEL